MPFEFDFDTTCSVCPYGLCVEDRRQNPVRGRATLFRVRQSVALGCTFDSFVPGSDNDSNPGRTLDEYLAQFRKNFLGAGQYLFGPEFKLEGRAIAKVEGDTFELIEAAAIWNAVAAWNQLMDTDAWNSSAFAQPDGSVPTPTRKVAVVKLPRGYDTTKLFQPAVRNSIRAHENALKHEGMELGLSSPDIVGVRLPHPLPSELELFSRALPNLARDNRIILELAYQKLEGQLNGAGFLLAIAVKRTTRSDRLYQPLFEANVLKYLIEVVLGGSAFRFYVHVGDFSGADVEGAYRAASVVSLMRGGKPDFAVDRVLLAQRPQEVAQTVLNELPRFPR